MIRQRAAPWLTLSTTLLLTAAATLLVWIAIESSEQTRFVNTVESTRERIRVRLEQYIAALRGGTGLFAASDHVSHTEFRAYVEHVNVQRDYPGIQGMGFARRTSHAALDSLQAAVREQGDSSYTISPRNEAVEHFPIVYLEPLDIRNRAAWGFDMYSDSVRANAMDRAWLSGEPAKSGKVILRQELDAPEPQPGFLIYDPVYSGGGVPTTEAERREKLLGFVYGPFRADDFFYQVFGQDRHPLVAFRVYDGEVSEENRLHDSAPDSVRSVRARYAMIDSLDVAGQPWLLEFETLPAFDQGAGRFLVPMILLVGLLVSFVLFRMTRAQVGARAKAEESEAARSRFFATMSHELRTPINAIMGYNDLLLGGIYGELPAPQAHSIGRAQKAARHLAELVNDVLDLSKIEAGKVRLDIEAVDVSEIIDDLSSTFGPMAESRGCVLDLTHSDCKQTIWTDPRRVRQILLNLLSNAAKFGAGKPIKLCCVATGEGVAIEVTDRGNGIAPGDINRIFEEFVQLEKGDPEGTGLGLAISRRLAVLLGGALEVDSTLHQGSTFRLKLPARSSRRMAVH